MCTSRQVVVVPPPWDGVAMSQAPRSRMPSPGPPLLGSSLNSSVSISAAANIHSPSQQHLPTHMRGLSPQHHLQQTLPTTRSVPHVAPNVYLSAAHPSCATPRALRAPFATATVASRTRCGSASPTPVWGLGVPVAPGTSTPSHPARWQSPCLGRVASTPPVALSSAAAVRVAPVASGAPSTHGVSPPASRQLHPPPACCGKRTAPSMQHPGCEDAAGRSAVKICSSLSTSSTISFAGYPLGGSSSCDDGDNTPHGRRIDPGDDAWDKAIKSELGESALCRVTEADDVRLKTPVRTHMDCGAVSLDADCAKQSTRSSTTPGPSQLSSSPATVSQAGSAQLEPRSLEATLEGCISATGIEAGSSQETVALDLAAALATEDSQAMEIEDHQIQLGRDFDGGEVVSRAQGFSTIDSTRPHAQQASTASTSKDLQQLAPGSSTLDWLGAAPWKCNGPKRFEDCTSDDGVLEMTSNTRQLICSSASEASMSIEGSWTVPATPGSAIIVAGTRSLLCSPRKDSWSPSESLKQIICVPQALGGCRSRSLSPDLALHSPRRIKSPDRWPSSFRTNASPAPGSRSKASLLPGSIAENGCTLGVDMPLGGSFLQKCCSLSSVPSASGSQKSLPPAPQPIVTRQDLSQAPLDASSSRAESSRCQEPSLSQKSLSCVEASAPQSAFAPSHLVTSSSVDPPTVAPSFRARDGFLERPTSCRSRSPSIGPARQTQRQSLASVPDLSTPRRAASLSRRPSTLCTQSSRAERGKKPLCSTFRVSEVAAPGPDFTEKPNRRSVLSSACAASPRSGRPSQGSGDANASYPPLRGGVVKSSGSHARAPRASAPAAPSYVSKTFARHRQQTERKEYVPHPHEIKDAGVAADAAVPPCSSARRVSSVDTMQVVLDSFPTAGEAIAAYVARDAAETKVKLLSPARFQRVIAHEPPDGILRDPVGLVADLVTAAVAPDDDVKPDCGLCADAADVSAKAAPVAASMGVGCRGESSSVAQQLCREAFVDSVSALSSTLAEDVQSRGMIYLF